MVVDTIADFLVSNIYRKKFLSIDYGTKFIGTAISDQSNIISIPYKTLDKKTLMNEIIEIIEKENIYGVIIGMPYHLDGSESEMSGQVRNFHWNYPKSLKIQFYYWMKDFQVRAINLKKRPFNINS